ncbi:MAG: hypothetical protein Q9202_005951 [Teloschistes flavicans]
MSLCTYADFTYNIMWTAIAILLIAVGYGSYYLWNALQTPSRKKPISVNYHFTRRCNYQCGFCFHTAKTSFIQPIDEAKRGIKLLVDAGMRKINFAGGEPFLYPEFLGELVRYCKDDLAMESVSIVTNGSKVTEDWFAKYADSLDIMAVSCDSFDEATNVQIGRGRGEHLKTFIQLSRLCAKYAIKFKVNTVVCRYNFQEDMNAMIEQVAPFRWKCFQVLIVPGENDSKETLRNAQKFKITDEEYQFFCNRHEHQKSLVPESNEVMKSSYLILDEYMRFLNKGVKEPTRSILEIGVPAAMDDVYWDDENFARRGGEYDWKKEKREGDGALDF